MDDGVSTPRGVALKIIDVPGERLPGSENDRTQNYVLGNSPSFQVVTAAAFLKQLRLLAATTGRAEPAKQVLSAVSRNANAALETSELKSATLTTLAGQAPTELLGDTFFSQAPLLHGRYFSKVSVAPVLSELVALSGRPLDLASHPDAIREGVSRHFSVLPATWELRMQLATDIDCMPIENAATKWPEGESRYRPVARITALPQESWSDAWRAAVEDQGAFAPWTGTSQRPMRYRPPLRGETSKAPPPTLRACRC